MTKTSYTFLGAAPGDGFGLVKTATVGDFDGDGLNDIFLATDSSDTNGNNSGSLGSSFKCNT